MLLEEQCFAGGGEPAEITLSENYWPLIPALIRVVFALSDAREGKLATLR